MNICRHSIEYELLDNNFFENENYNCIENNNLNLFQNKKIKSKFFKKREPSKWFNLKLNEKGYICVDYSFLTEEVNKIEKIIYIFWNRKSDVFLIGKTSGSLKKRISGYLYEFNHHRIVEKTNRTGRHVFLDDVKRSPTDFSVGILYALAPDEDLDIYEELFIREKRELYRLYNTVKGGGGGSSHDEETPIRYTIPEGVNITPTKYYPYAKDEEGRIRVQLTPSIKKRKREACEDPDSFVYAIKNFVTDERYIGVSGHPSFRAVQHAREAEYGDPDNIRYNPSRCSGLVHSAIAENPEHFGFGIFPLRKRFSNRLTKRKVKSVFGIGELETHMIQEKKAHRTEHGYNCNFGGGGPIPKRLSYD